MTIPYGAVLTIEFSRWPRWRVVIETRKWRARVHVNPKCWVWDMRPDLRWWVLGPLDVTRTR